MEVMDFAHSFNNNDGGRLCLSINRTPNDIFIDMCTMDRTHKKQVPLRDLYETNPEIIEHGVVTLTFPRYVTETRARDWRQALDTAFQVGRDVADSMKNHPDTLTDSEEDEEDVLPEVVLRPSSSSVVEPIDKPSVQDLVVPPPQQQQPSAPPAPPAPPASHEPDASEAKKKKNQLTDPSTESDVIHVGGGDAVVVTKVILDHDGQQLEPTLNKSPRDVGVALDARSLVEIPPEFDPRDW